MTPTFVPQGLACLDGTTSLAHVSNKALTSNVATLTTANAHGFAVGMQVLIKLDTPDAIFDGTYLIASVPTSTTFTYAKTHANVSSVAATGFVNSQGFVSPIAAGTTEVALKFPPTARKVLIYSDTALANYRAVSGGATGGIYPIPLTTTIELYGIGGDTIYIGRPNSTAIYFAFNNERGA